MVNRQTPYPGLEGVVPGPSLFPGVGLGDTAQIGGYIIGNTGSTAPYVAILDADQRIDTGRTVRANINNTATFLLAPPNPGPPTWSMSVLVRSMEQAEALTLTLAHSDYVNISEWGSRAFAVIGAPRATASPTKNQAAWWIVNLEMVQL